jgi:peptidoglycan/xylan/chitin deacetylase (PgdA/CDA1 family)
MTVMLKLTKGLKEIPIEAKRLLRHSYPPFVLANKPNPLRDEAPVFMFHSVERETFAAQLAFLAQNHYQTLTLPTFMAFLSGKQRLERPSVLLTFDDGHKNWYEVAYPLLRKYGFHAIGFLVPTFIKQQPTPGAWLSWPEVLEMEQSRVMHFESHTAHHDQVFVAPRLVDFYHPTYNHNPLGLDTPWVNEGASYTNRLRWGTPIYTHASRYSGQRRFLDDVRVREACMSLVNEHGGEPFFARPDWRQALTRIYKTTVNQSIASQYESKEEQRIAILDGLVKAKDMLHKRLGRPAHHLCYPWGIGSELAVALSRAAGYVSNFWVVTAQRNSNRPGDNPFYIPRLKDDYLCRLPGSGRQSLASIFSMKLRRRSKSANIY